MRAVDQKPGYNLEWPYFGSNTLEFSAIRSIIFVVDFSLGKVLLSHKTWILLQSIESLRVQSFVAS